MTIVILNIGRACIYKTITCFFSIAACREQDAYMGAIALTPVNDIRTSNSSSFLDSSFTWNPDIQHSPMHFEGESLLIYI